MARLWTLLKSLFGGHAPQRPAPAGSRSGRSRARRAPHQPRPAPSSAPVAPLPPSRIPNEDTLPADRVALIREALATHRAKRRVLDHLDDEDRGLLEALAFSALFFPSAGPGGLVRDQDGAPGDGSKPAADDRG